MESANTPENHNRNPEDESKTVSHESEQDRPQDPREIGGPPGPEPTRYGDWEKGGRCIDF